MYFPINLWITIMSNERSIYSQDNENVVVLSLG